MAEPYEGVAVSARGLTRTYGKAHALRDVDLDLAAGQVHGLLGRNGAGKSTHVHRHGPGVCHCG
ncbi:ATP-binding cassette domain-containing protein [Nesterenkonia pannonica]|uniref:ATP-binding cassette domain-containing protein n=1 Tax=Nesterenkonia pannonica TaxID=1548602 RepID=UPI00216462FF|nr:ATP-binding cassette domain-containing protein [Nesterenkonia pannonica]